MTLSELEQRIVSLLNAIRPSPVKSAMSLNLADLEAAYRYALARREETLSKVDVRASIADIAISIEVDKSTLHRCIDELKLLNGSDDAWQAALIRDFPELKRLAIQLLSGGVPDPPKCVIACPPSVATSFMPKVLNAIWSGADYPDEFDKVRIEVRQTHDNERDIREMAAGSVRMKIVESYAVEPESLKAVGITAERLFDSMPLGLVYPRSNKTAAAVFDSATNDQPLEWNTLSGQTFLLTHSYRIADALAELLPPPSKGGGRVYLTTLNNVRACLVAEGMNAIGIGVDPKRPGVFGHYSFSSLPDDKLHRFLRSNAVVSYSVLYPSEKQPAAKPESGVTKRSRRVRVDPLDTAQRRLLRAMKSVAMRYTHTFES